VLASRANRWQTLVREFKSRGHALRLFGGLLQMVVRVMTRDLDIFGLRLCGWWIQEG